MGKLMLFVIENKANPNLQGATSKSLQLIQIYRQHQGGSLAPKVQTKSHRSAPTS